VKVERKQNLSIFLATFWKLKDMELAILEFFNSKTFEFGPLFP
jgi:hypothetical protein